VTLSADPGWLRSVSGPRAGLTALVVFVAFAVVVLMSRGRRRRAERNADVPPLLPAAAASGRPLLPPLRGLFLGTTSAGDWLDRVTAHGLGDRAAARLVLTREGIAVQRDDAGFLIPREEIAGARTDEAHAGAWVGEGGILVVTWRHGERLLDTGFRADDQREHARWAAALSPAEARAVGGPTVVENPETGAPVPTDDADSPAPVDPQTVDPHAVDPLTAPLPDVVSMIDVAQPVTGEQPGHIDQPVGVDRRQPEPAAPALVGRARPPAVLVLEDGRTFHGEAYGAVGETVGEAVFNTGMTGYQETLTDPSYHRQVVVQTAPQIGNTGVNDEDPESARIWVAGYVVRDPSRISSSWRAKRSLDAELATQGVVGISGVDTRALTRHLRERGAMRVGVSSVDTDPQALLGRVLDSPGMLGADLAREVSTQAAYVVPAQGERRFRVAAVDLGIKASTPRYMSQVGCEVHVLPATATAEDILAVAPDGVFFSNGPGDPATADYAVAAMQGVLGVKPVFGICFGNQMLGRALGFGTYKLKYGHRGVNQPVQDRHTQRVHITSHNHGFAVDAPVDGPTQTAYGRVEVSHVDLNDGVVEGLRCLDVPAFSVQYHPEAAPGPHDATGLISTFAELMEASR
jgi:carbamoyl-phosphate synthase small subunit